MQQPSHSAVPGLRLGIIGGGRAAWAFGSSWRASGQTLSGIGLRSESNSQLPALLSTPRVDSRALIESSDVILIAVSDGAIADVSASLELRPDRAVFHASGSQTSELLPPVSARFSLHPLRALPPAGTAISLEGALLVAEGTAAGLKVARTIADNLEARLATIEAAQKPVYHAAAVFAANYVAVMLDIARRLMNSEGIVLPGLERELAALAESAIANWETQSGPMRFTGPASRGDLAVVARHLEALGGASSTGRIYAALAAEILNSTGSPEVSERATAELRKWLKGNA